MPKKTFEAAAVASAHLIVQLKENQPILWQKVEAVCATAKPQSSVQTVDQKRRNRHETRAIAVFTAAPAVAGTEWEPHVAAIIKVERAINVRQPATGLWKPSSEISFYLSGRPVDRKPRRARHPQALGNREQIPLHARRHFPRRCLAHSNQSWNCRKTQEHCVQYPALQPIQLNPSRPLRHRSRRPQINILHDVQ